jgi:hypothetical protein
VSGPGGEARAAEAVSAAGPAARRAEARRVLRGLLQGGAVLLAVAAFAVPVPAGRAAGDGRGAVDAPGGTALRQAPDDAAPVLGTARDGARVTVLCVTTGDDGRRWYLVHGDRYAWADARAVRRAGRAPGRC